MPIIHMDSNNKDSYPTGAYCPLPSNYNTWPDDIVLYTTHEGLCLFERERNMYDDSDFFMTVWNEEKGCPEEFNFATTRAWCAPCFGSKVDATPEVREKYAAWLADKEERERVEALRMYRNKRWEELRRIHRMEMDVLVLYGVPAGHLFRLRKAFGGYHNVSEKAAYPDILNLMISKRIRSQFKLGLRRQVLNWLKDPNPKYPMPLSPKQTDCL